MLSSWYWSNHPWMSNLHKVYITSAFGSLGLKIGMSKHAGARCFIQGYYHGIIVMHITKCMVHVCQKFRDGNVPAILQGMHLPTQVSLQTGMNVRHHAFLLVLVQPSLDIKPPQSIHHFCIWICGLKNWHVQACRSKAFHILPPPATSTTECFAHSGVSIQICTSCIWRGRG